MLRNQSMPPGVIIPELAYADLGAAVTWLCDSFGFRERLRIADHRAQLVLGDASIVATQDTAERAGDITLTPSARAGRVMVRVADVDAHHQRASSAGARILHPPTDYPYGERQYAVQDLGGHVWIFSESIADVDPADWGGQLVET